MGSLFGGSTSRLYQQNQQIQNQLFDLQQQSYDDEAAALIQEGELLNQDAQNAAEQKVNEVKNVMADQAVAYLNSGVTLADTPLDVIDRTRRAGLREATALYNRGEAQRSLYTRRAQQIRSAGRASILGQRYGQGVEQARNEMAANRAFGNTAYNLIGQGLYRAGTPLVSNLWGALKSLF